MKKLRILLSVVAIVFAFGATFAMNSDDVNVIGYEFIPASGGVPRQCIERSVDCEGGPNDCTLNGHDVKATNTTTVCGPTLKME